MNDIPNAVRSGGVRVALEAIALEAAVEGAAAQAEGLGALGDVALENDRIHGVVLGPPSGLD